MSAIAPRHLLMPWLDGYERAWLRGDIATGLLVVAIAIPLSMGMAEVAGVPPVAGLYTCVLPLIAYSCIGASRHLVIGLDASTAVMMAAAVAPLAGGDEGRYLALAGTLTLLVGAILVLAGGLRLGSLARLLSNPALLGYQAGLGVTVIINQVHRVIGVPVTRRDPLPRAVQLIGVLGQVNGWTLGIGIGVIAAVVTVRRRAPVFPTALVAIVTSTVVVGAGGLGGRGVALVGDVPSGLPGIAIPDVSTRDVTSLLAAAAGIAIVASADTIATARSFAVRNGYHLDTNRELIALGTANCVSGLAGGITASASAARTAVAEATGGRTPLASAVAGAALALVLVLFTGALESVPMAALAAVVIAAVARIVDIPSMVGLARVRPREAAIAVITLATVVAAGTLEGIGVAAGLAIVDAVSRRRRVDSSPGISSTRAAPGVAALRPVGPMCYINAERVARNVTEVADRHPRTDLIVVDVRGVTDVDATAADTLRELARELEQGGQTLRLADPPSCVAHDLDRYGLSTLVLEPGSPVNPMRRRPDPTGPSTLSQRPTALEERSALPEDGHHEHHHAPGRSSGSAQLGR
jgi:sulfate permease, SulP family